MMAKTERDDQPDPVGSRRLSGVDGAGRTPLGRYRLSVPIRLARARAVPSIKARSRNRPGSYGIPGISRSSSDGRCIVAEPIEATSCSPSTAAGCRFTSGCVMDGNGQVGHPEGASAHRGACRGRGRLDGRRRGWARARDRVADRVRVLDRELAASTPTRCAS